MIPVGHPVQGAFSQALLGVVAAVRHQKCRAQGQDPSCDPLEPCVRTACEVMDSHKKQSYIIRSPAGNWLLEFRAKDKGFCGVVQNRGYLIFLFLTLDSPPFERYSPPLVSTGDTH